MSSSMQKPTILAVDDSPIIQEMIKRTLANDYNVLLANSAVDALSLIYHQSIALLLLDVSMPEVDGLELCRTLRSMPQFRDLPIMLLTARDKAFDKVQGRLAGATEYLTKPFDGEQLLQMCKKLINSKGSTAVQE